MPAHRLHKPSARRAAFLEAVRDLAVAAQVQRALVERVR